MRALLDTSFFVANETGRPLAALDGVTETEVSVLTVAELTLGVLMADDTTRPARLATLTAVESTWEPLPVDAPVARHFAQLVATLKRDGRRVPIVDALIAATAVTAEIAVVTQDNDYSAFRDLEVIRV